MALPLIPALIGGLGAAASSLVGRVLIALGVSYVTFSGTNILIDNIVGGIKTNMAGMGGQAVRFLSYMWMDRALSMLFAAWTACMALKMAGSSTIKRMIIK